MHLGAEKLPNYKNFSLLSASQRHSGSVGFMTGDNFDPLFKVSSPDLSTGFVAVVVVINE